MKYLTGDDEYFGPNLGGATVYTNIRQGLVSNCPNIGALLANLEVTLAMENEIIARILNEGAEPKAAVRAWLSANPEVVTSWLSGVKTRDGSDAISAVKARLN